MTRPFGLFNDDFDRVLNSLVNMGRGYSDFITSNFPPVNVFTDEDKNLSFQFALAGYNKEDINISFSGDYMVLRIDPAEKEKKEGVKCIHRGIKHAKFATKYYVPHERYDTDNVTASFEDGILRVEVPSKAPEKARLIEIK